MDIPETGSLASNEPPSAADSPDMLRPWGRKMVSLYTLAQFGWWVALITPIAITLALRVAEIDPVHKAISYGLVLGVGSFAHLFIGPIMGVISDRTTSRLGRRRPWLLIGSIAGFLALLLIALAKTIPLIMLGWGLTQITFSIMGTAMSTMLPDQVPSKQLGKLSGLTGMAQQIGTVIGIAIASIFSNSSIFLAFMLPAALGLITTLLLALIMSDRPINKEALDPFHLRDFVKTFWVNPRKHPDYGWTWAGSFLVQMAISFYGNYALYFLIDRLHYTLAQVPMLQLIGVLVTMVAAVGAAIGGGFLSDRFRRRKIFVVLATLLYGTGVVIIAFAPTFTIYLLGGGLAGAANGMYAAVSQALMVEVLPNKEAAGKDMGVFSLSVLLPQSLAPTIAPLFLAIAGGNNYTALYLIAGLFFVAGAVAIQPIKSVR